MVEAVRVFKVEEDLRAVKVVKDKRRRIEGVKVDLSSTHLQKKGWNWLAEVHAIRHLVTLDLNSCDVAFIPDAIGTLTTLHRLRLHDNCLRAVPDSICDLTKLRILTLFENYLEQLPSNMWKLDKLKVLRVGGNKLAHEGLDSLVKHRSRSAASSRPVYHGHGGGGYYGGIVAAPAPPKKYLRDSIRRLYVRDNQPHISEYYVPSELKKKEREGRLTVYNTGDESEPDDDDDAFDFD